MQSPLEPNLGTGRLNTRNARYDCECFSGYYRETGASRSLIYIPKYTLEDFHLVTKRSSS